MLLNTFHWFNVFVLVSSFSMFAHCGITSVVIFGDSCYEWERKVTHSSSFEYPSTALGEQSSLKPQCANKTFTVNGVSFVMVKVDGGTFMMGATSEQGNIAISGAKPTHQVTLSSFYIGQTEVTQELWKAVMGKNPSHCSGYNYGNTLQRPVEKVSYDDCQVFLRKLNALTGEHFNLPTEAQWEYAARGGNKSKGYKFAGSNNVDDVAWDDNNSRNATHDVAIKHPNELGLYDMTGNVYEWCQDWYGDYSSSSQINPMGPVSGSLRVCRGGCWWCAGFCHLSYRNAHKPDYRSFYIGLRLAL